MSMIDKNMQESCRSRLSNDDVQLTRACYDSPLYQASASRLPLGCEGPRLSGSWAFRFNMYDLR